MPAVRSSTGQLVVLRCSEDIARRLGMVRTFTEAGAALEARRLVFPVDAVHPYVPFTLAYLWPWEPDLKGALEEE